MLTSLSMWLLYISSYSVAYLFLIFEIIIIGVVDNKSTTSSIWRKVIEAITSNGVPIILLLALLILSFVYMKRMNTWRNNTRVRFTVNRNLTFETTGMLASYILPLICCGFNVYLGLVLFTVILLVGIAIIRGGYLYTCCIFLLKRYYVYSSDDGAIVITKVKMEKFNLEQRDNPNGIEVRQIAKGIYLSCEN